MLGVGEKSGPATCKTPRSSARAENNPPLKVFSKWPESKGAAEAHERTQGAHVLALEGREAAATDPA